MFCKTKKNMEEKFSKQVADFNLPHLYLAPSFEFQ